MSEGYMIELVEIFMRILWLLIIGPIVSSIYATMAILTSSSKSSWIREFIKCYEKGNNLIGYVLIIFLIGLLVLVFC